MYGKSSLKKIVKSRIEETKSQREKSLKAIYSNRPLNAEQDEKRKINRLKSVANVDLKQAKQIINYKKDALTNLEGNRLIGAESIQGKTIDFLSVAFIELANAASGTVGRILKEDLTPEGSGFMISDKLFLTNNHVIPDETIAKKFFVEFNYELDFNNKPKRTTRFIFNPQEFFITSPEHELDFTLIAIGNRDTDDNNGNLNLFDIGYCPLVNSNDKHVLGERINIIQHPEGNYKQIILRENQLIARLDKVLHYVADTNPGSSGSPVFNDQWEVIAVHHWGEPTILETPDGKPLRKDVNEGVRISKIVEFLKSQNLLEISKQRLLDEAINQRFRHPSVLTNNSKDVRSITTLEGRDVKERNFNSDNIRIENTTDKVATLNVPLEISIHIGDIGLSHNTNNDNETFTIGEQEAIRIDRNYSNRSGYDQDFLPNYQVPLPVLNEMQKNQAAKKINIPEDDSNEYELKYEHFSLVMNAQRRMAFFTAVNIDGSTWIDIDRDSGQPRREAFETWFIDPRIPTTDQSSQSLYSNQRPRRIFDRGHLVRRQDPCWGNNGLAIRANADTFHFTNCTPMESIFNQRIRYWLGLENYVLDNAKAENEKVSVFTGPVFDDNDPRYRYTRVPLQFWKILIRVENGNLLATALLANQSRRISRLPEGLSEGFDDIIEIQEYQTSVHEIERITGLDFGNLRHQDTFQEGRETISRKVKLNSYNDIQL
ncbi:MAG: DNA/RNA non-specific endonuclease [Nitrososphaeraceae archaeon]